MGGPLSIRLEFTSAFEVLDFVQVVSDQVGRDAGLDDDAVHWMGVAIRESVINAIHHGNQSDLSKHVFVEFFDRDATEPGASASATRARIRSRRRWPIRSPRRICSRRAAAASSSFAASWTTCGSQRASEGGMEVLMTKRVPPGRRLRPVLNPLPHDPLLSDHRRRGRRARRRRDDGALRPRDARRQEGRDRSGDRGGRRDRARVPRDHRRAFPRSRGARRGVRRKRDRARGPLLGLRSDRRHHELRARPADLLFVARARSRRRGRGRRGLRSDAEGAVHGGAGRGRVPERPSAPRLGGQRARRRHARHRLPVRRAPASRGDRRPLRARSSPGREPSVVSARPPSISATWPPAAWTGSGRAISSPGTSPAARSSSPRPAEPSPTWKVAPSRRVPDRSSPRTDCSTTPCWLSSANARRPGLSGGRLE